MVVLLSTQDLIRALQTAHLNSLDDGRVVNHQSVVDAEALRR